jgi:hypothetical protein
MSAHLLLCVVAALHQPVHDLSWRGLVLEVVDGTCSRSGGQGGGETRCQHMRAVCGQPAAEICARTQYACTPALAGCRRLSRLVPKVGPIPRATTTAVDCGHAQLSQLPQAVVQIYTGIYNYWNMSLTCFWVHAPAHHTLH